MISEREIQKDILDWLSRKSIVHWRVPLGGVTQAGGKFKSKNPMTGHPDIAGIAPATFGRYFAIEVKTTNGKLSDRQIYWRELLTHSGVLYILARSLDEVQYHFAREINFP